ncbi:MAG: hypothetical protein ACPL7B_03780, partial [Candidatus Poribacteria bacterium]
MNNITLLQTQIIDVKTLECPSNTIDIGLMDNGKNNSIFNEILNNLLVENNIDNEIKNINQDPTTKNPMPNKSPILNISDLKFGQDAGPITTIKTEIDSFVDGQSKINQAFMSKALTPIINENLTKIEKTESKITIANTENPEPKNIDRTNKDANFIGNEITTTLPLAEDIWIEKIDHKDNQYINNNNQLSRTLGYIDTQPPVITNNETIFQNDEIKTIEITQNLYDRDKELLPSNNIEQTKPEAITIVKDDSKTKAIDKKDMEFTEKEITITPALTNDRPKEDQGKDININQIVDRPSKQTEDIWIEKIDHKDNQYIN